VGTGPAGPAARGNDLKVVPYHRSVRGVPASAGPFRNLNVTAPPLPRQKSSGALTNRPPSVTFLQRPHVPHVAVDADGMCEEDVQGRPPMSHPSVF